MNTGNFFIKAQNLHPDLLFVKEQLYPACNFICSEPAAEAESQEYGAYQFILNTLNVLFRVAKTTPAKSGKFVTLWKRSAMGPIEPFNESDNIDLVVIITRHSKHFGQFVFPKSVLVEKGIFTSSHKEGKRALRVYPPWDVTSSKQAKNTQQWQLNYFLDIPYEKPIDIMMVKKLYTIDANI